MKDYKNFTTECNEFTGLGLSQPIVKASSYEDKFTLLDRYINKSDIKLLLDEVYKNMASELRRQIVSYPGIWTKVEFKNEVYRYTDLRIESIKKYIPKELGVHQTLAKASANGVNEYLNKAINIADDQSLVHAIGNSRLFCTNNSANAYELLNESEDAYEFFDSFLWNYFPDNADAKKRWTGSYFLKISEAMCLKGWLLYPLMPMPKNTIYFFDPTSGLQYSTTTSNNKSPFINKVFVENYNQNRLTNLINMVGIINSQNKSDSKDCYGFIRRLTYMTNASGIEGVSEELCIHLTNSTTRNTLPRNDAPIERLVNDYLNKERKNLQVLPEHVFVYKERKDRDSEKAKVLKRYIGEFNWVSEKNSLLKTWGELFTEYAPSSTLTNITDVASALNPVLDWLLQLRDDEIEDLHSPSAIDRSYHIYSYQGSVDDRVSVSLIDYLKTKSTKVANNALNELEKFCIWYSIKHDNHFEIPVNSSDRRQFSKKNGHDKSNKEVIPTQLFRLMKSILTDNDYEWPKSIDSDWTGRKSGNGDWCPSRALMLETMMILPIRYSNVMSADIGLFDELWFDHDKNAWEINQNGEKGRSSGFLKLITDGASGQNITVFYFVLDKVKHNGLTVSWENTDLIRTLIRQRKFIIDNNCVNEFRLDANKSEKGKDRLLYKSINPLFIDFAHKDSKFNKKPVSYERLNDFFKLLQVEAERRFNATEYGRKNPIKIVFKYRNNIPIETLFTLHCLRVTGITQFAIAGLPPSVISEALSGHHSLVMNLYYTKFTPSLINKLISAKAHTIELDFDLISLDDWKNDIELFRQVIEVNVDSSAFHNIEKKSIHFMTLMDGFICPNGASKCDEGYTNTAKGAKHSEVSGGKGNCPNCRFAMTGPMLLNQQVLSANQKLSEIEQLVKKQKSFLIKAEESQKLGHEYQYHEQLKFFDAMQPEIDSKMDSWLSRVSFINKSAQKMPVWEKIESLRKDGLSVDEIKSYLKSLSVQQDEKTLITTSTSEDIRVVFEACETKAEMIAINACAEQIMQTTKTTCTDKLINYMSKALFSSGCDPFIISLDEFNSSRAAILHAQFLTEYLQAHHQREFNDNRQSNFNSAIGRIEMGRFLDNPKDNVLPTDIKRAWSAINKLIIDQGSCSELPLSLDVFLQDKESLFSSSLLSIVHDS